MAMRWAASARMMVAAYRFGRRVRDKAVSVAFAGAFADFGAHSVLELPIRLVGEGRISVGSDVYVGAGSWLQSLAREPGEPTLVIGDGTSIAGSCVLSAAQSVVLGRKVLLARNVYISDHIHAYDDVDSAVLDQGLARIEPVRIGDGAWIGQNVVICPGVEVGSGAVVGANSVVTADVPAHSLAVGAPAHVVRSFARELEAVS